MSSSSADLTRPQKKLLKMILTDPASVRRYVKKHQLAPFIRSYRTSAGGCLLHVCAAHGKFRGVVALHRLSDVSLSLQDDAGDTPLHIALAKVCSGDATLREVHDSLLDSLRPKLLHVPNRRGVTPADMLEWLTPTSASGVAPGSQPLPRSRREEEFTDWSAKLAEEAAFEIHVEGGFDGGRYAGEPFGESWTDTPCFEDFESWADRIYAEYQRKRRKSQVGEEESESEKRERKKRRKEEERREEDQKEFQKKRLERLFLRYSAICDRLCSIQTRELTEFLSRHTHVLTDVLRWRLAQMEQTEQKKFLRSQLRLWHPDKIKHTFQALTPTQMEALQPKLQELSQLLTNLLSE
ncbi:unnamed protein product [Cyprideis torosa]|uniref:NF-kappa-B inhibitor-like protein 1 n=1 Tax=Cyprideis torosa TaxID=163714 RepID=A0A7R8ZQA0_9CRUS|nr:unnamed protein product [Cyprideis torosa]CAG0900875.1 unnamed protein product [Cyprideis torosa]